MLSKFLYFQTVLLEIWTSKKIFRNKIKWKKKKNESALTEYYFVQQSFFSQYFLRPVIQN